jgi:RND superfamily putative drug exporter
MFTRLGSFAVRFRWYVIAAWLAAAAVLTFVAPNIDDVSVSDQRAFLSSEVPSLQANELMKEHFPDQVALSSAVLVVDAGPEGDVTAGEAGAFVSDLTDWLTASDAPQAIDEVWSPTRGDELTRAEMTSDDGQVALILVRFNAVATEPTTQEALAAIRARLAETPGGVSAYLTGDGPILDAYSTASLRSMDSVTWITIVLVLVILVLIYRSPVSPIIPLATIGLAYLISRAVIAFLGAGPLTISMYTNVFLLVVLFGAGTDYCLFLISRFREEMAGSGLAAPAVKTTVRAVGETIASSAGTVIVGLAMMVFAELGLYNTTGPSIAIGVAITLLAGLTLIPALLSILGHHAFWPRKASRMKDQGLWPSWAAGVVKRPLLALLIPVIVLVPLAWYGNGTARDFDMLADLPKDDEARRGFDVLAEHVGAGNMRPLNVLVIDTAGLDTPTGLVEVQGLQSELAGLQDVAEVRGFTTLLPDRSTLSVADQLATVAREVADGIAAVEATTAAGPPEGPVASALLETAAAGLTDVFSYLTQLSAAYPETLQEPGYQQAMDALSTLVALASTSGQPGPQPGEALVPLRALADGLDILRVSFSARPEAILLPDLYLESNEGLRNLRDAYYSSDGTVARLQVVLASGPYSEDALDAVGAINETLAEQGLDGAVEGNSAILRDLRDSSDRDLNKAFIFVLGGIFVVLLLLLRALVAPIYLILTILLSYSATLGVVRLIFVDALGAGGITWWVPMFMFVMLVALGMDYNIFLIGRVKEEVANLGTRDGTRLALARTGGIITSAGIIMAGTFASMMAGSLLGLMQIGFAVAFGVLLDTFVVRTTLVPALTVLLGRWAWWPRRGPGPRRKARLPREGHSS